MEDIFQYIESNNDFKLSMDDLFDKVLGLKPTMRTIKERLMEKYRYTCIFSRVSSKQTVVCVSYYRRKMIE